MLSTDTVPSKEYVTVKTHGLLTLLRPCAVLQPHCKKSFSALRRVRRMSPIEELGWFLLWRPRLCCRSQEPCKF